MARPRGSTLSSDATPGAPRGIVQTLRAPPGCPSYSQGGKSRRGLSRAPALSSDARSNARQRDQSLSNGTSRHRPRAGTRPPVPPDGPRKSANPVVEPQVPQEASEEGTG